MTRQSLSTDIHNDLYRDGPAISIIVCTRDRDIQLRRCLSSLQKIAYPNFEVIVVDNASLTEATRNVVNDMAFSYIRENTPGLDWARNRGMTEAQTEIIAYIDDDAIADPKWLHEIASAFCSSDTVCVTGLVLPAEIETRAQHLFEQYGNGMSKGSLIKTFREENLSLREMIRTHQMGIGTNMAFRKSFLKRLDGFDTALDVGTPSNGCGDLDLFFRLLTAGGTIHYEPNAVVWHHHRREMNELQQQIYNNGRSYGVYLIKRWRAYSLKNKIIMLPVIGEWLIWLAGRLLLRAIRCHRLPFSLLWSELRGALSAPRAYCLTYEHDEKLRKKSPNP